MTKSANNPVLPCPACIADGWGGQARIGNRRSTCATCNNFVRVTEQRALRQLRVMAPDLFERLRLEEAAAEYRALMERWFNDDDEGED